MKKLTLTTAALVLWLTALPAHAQYVSMKSLDPVYFSTNSSSVSAKGTGTGIFAFQTSPLFNTSVTLTNGSTGSDIVINGNSANTWLLGMTINGGTMFGFTNNGTLYSGNLNANLVISTQGYRQTQGALTHAGTVNLDFDSSTATLNTLTLTGSVTFTDSNLQAGRWFTLFVTGTSTNSPLNFPQASSTNTWRFQTGAPTTIGALKTATLTLYSTGTTDPGVRAWWQEEP